MREVMSGMYHSERYEHERFYMTSKSKLDECNGHREREV